MCLPRICPYLFLEKNKYTPPAGQSVYQRSNLVQNHLKSLENNNLPVSVDMDHKGTNSHQQQQSYEMEGGQPEIAVDDDPLMQIDETGKKNDGGVQDASQQNHLLIHPSGRGTYSRTQTNESEYQASIFQKVANRVFRPTENINRRIKRPMEFRLFYWMGLTFLFLECLIYLALIISINAFFKARDQNSNLIIRMLV